jgi:hypothetical protein
MGLVVFRSELAISLADWYDAKAPSAAFLC